MVTAIVVTSGCKQGSTSDSSSSSLRVVNAVSSSTDLKISVDGKTLAESVDFADDSGFKGVAPGHYSFGIGVDSPQGTSRLYPIDLTVNDDTKYTAIAYGLATPGVAPEFALFNEPNDAPTTRSDKAQVRVFNASPGSGKLDLLINSIVAFKNVEYGTRSESIPLAALPYEWTVKLAGDSVDPLIQPVTLQLKGGKSYLVVILGRPEDQSLTLKAIEE